MVTSWTLTTHNTRTMALSLCSGGSAYCSYKNFGHTFLETRLLTSPFLRTSQVNSPVSDIEHNSNHTMLSHITLRALLRRELARAASIKPAQQAACRRWRLLPHTYNKPAQFPTRAQKICPLSLLQVATGAYQTRTTTSESDHDSSPVSSAETALIIHPVYGRWWELDTYLSAAASSKTSIDTSVTVDSGYGSTGMSPTIKPQGEVVCCDDSGDTYTDNKHQETHDEDCSGTATYDTHHAAEFPGVPPREFPKLPQEGLDTVRIAALGMAKARSKKRSPNAPFAPRPRKVSRKTALCLTERNGKLPQPLRKVLEEAEDEYIDLEDCIWSAFAPLFDYSIFGCTFTTLVTDINEALTYECQPFNLTLHKLMEEAKAFYRLGEFDPSCLTADGGVRSGSIERSFLDDIPDELHELFIAYLRQLAMPRSYLVYNKKWKAAYRLERADAEFADNAFLATLLRYQDPFAPVPFGRNPMIDEYWRRRGHTYETLVREYFRINRAYAEKQDREWLRGADAMEIEYECFVGILDPSGEWLDLEIPELENLPVALVTEHPYKEDYAVVTRVYEEWEPLEQWGEERFPDCVEGDEARMCLDNYRSKMEFPPAYLEFCAKRELEEESW
ncbi:hypothetical protein FB567DRAFT_615162 [Paraphoma chrysanthemicola]|uniref:Uncharacterized protein n=1 Tax=Paraphoma chrysanthemicola TaxID=798071 RepID=A0A8K0QU62_9PLEO|nr:hypothetical protein FB567DRAFT_615162 [Paraphoma chrysanthemicola]